MISGIIFRWTSLKTDVIYKRFKLGGYLLEFFIFVKVDKGWGNLKDLGIKKKIRNISVGT